MPFEVRTLRQFLESDQVIDCDCSNYWACTHTGPLRIEAAIQRLGWDFDFYDGRPLLARAVYCSVCGKYEPTFRLGWKERPSTYSGSHGAGMTMMPIEQVAQARRTKPWSEPADFLRGGTNVRRFGPKR